MKNHSLDTKAINTAIRYREANFEEIVDGTGSGRNSRVRKGTLLSSPRLSADFPRAKLSTLPHEGFALIFLDKHHRFVACDELLRGTIDGASVYPREVVKEALKHDAAAMILAHNHPSGVAEPSLADQRITGRRRRQRQPD